MWGWMFLIRGKFEESVVINDRGIEEVVWIRVYLSLVRRLI